MEALPDKVERAYKAFLDAVECERDNPGGGFAAALRLVRASAKKGRDTASSTRENCWRLAIDAWDDGFEWSIIPFIAGLRDVNSEKLPFEVTLFLVDLALGQGKKKFKPHIFAKTYIQKIYPVLLKAEQKKDRSQRDGLSASEKVKNDLVEMFGGSYSSIDQIVSPRPSRRTLKEGLGQTD